MTLFIEQCLNGLQFGLLLFLLAAGLESEQENPKSERAAHHYKYVH